MRRFNVPPRSVSRPSGHRTACVAFTPRVPCVASSKLSRVASASLVALAITFGAVRSASADDDPRKAQADALFQEGLKLHDKDRETEALAKFEKAFEILPSPNALFWIAREEQLLGRGVDALTHYRAALENPLLHPGNVTPAKEYIAQLEKFNGRVLVTGPAGTRVRVGSREVTLPMKAPVDVAPGSLVVRGERDGHAFESEGIVSAGETTTLTLNEGPSTAETATTARSSFDDSPAAARTEHSPARWLVPVGLGAVALAAAGIGVGLTVTANADADDIDRLRALTGSSGQPCAAASALVPCRDLARKIDERDDHRALATGFFIGAGAAAVASVATLVLWPRTSSSNRGATVLPLVSPGLAGLQLHHAF